MHLMKFWGSHHLAMMWQHSSEARVAALWEEIYASSSNVQYVWCVGMKVGEEKVANGSKWVPASFNLTGGLMMCLSWWLPTKEEFSMRRWNLIFGNEWCHCYLVTLDNIILVSRTLSKSLEADMEKQHSGSVKFWCDLLWYVSDWWGVYEQLPG